MKPFIIDAREEQEFESGHVEGAVNIPPMQFMTWEVPAVLKDWPKDSEIIVYCRTGSRSRVVANILQQFGYTNITNGINAGHVERLLASK